MDSDEYHQLILLLNKALKKLKNRQRSLNSPLTKLAKYVHIPKSRKSNINAAGAILFARELYVHFLELFGKPLYSTIADITNIMFETSYSDSEIIKFAVPVRKARQRLDTLSHKHPPIF